MYEKEENTPNNQTTRETLSEISKFFDNLEDKNEGYCISYFKNIKNKAWTFTDDHGFTPLHKSIYLNLQTLTMVIIETISNNINQKEVKSFINAKNDKGFTALHYASFLGDIFSIKLLLKNGADVFAKTNAGFSVIHFSSQSNKLTPIFYLVTKYKMNINIKDNKGNTCLHIACFYNSNKIIDYLLSQKNIKINEKNNEGYTPLHFCVLSNNERALKKLLICSADVNIRNNKGEKAIDIAEKNKQFSFVKLLSGFFRNIKIHHPNNVLIFHTLNITLFFSIFLIGEYKLYYIIWFSLILMLLGVFYCVDNSVKNDYINLMDEIEKNNMSVEEYCTVCNIKHNKKDVHCFLCRKCISDFDHHCIWLGKCIGNKNKNIFLILLIFLLIHYYLNAIIITREIIKGKEKELKFRTFFIYFIFGLNIFVCAFSTCVILPLIKLYCKRSQQRSSSNIDFYKNENKNLLSTGDLISNKVENLINSI